MTTDQLKHIITQGESETVEFKSNFNDAVIETLSAFANTNGGTVIIGLDNQGIPIKGFTIGDETIQKWINEIKNKTIPFIVPDVEKIEINGQIIIRFSIPEYPVKPVSFKGRYYQRVKNSNHQLSLVEISHLHLKSLNTSWDNYPSSEYSQENISLEKVQRFIQNTNIIKEHPIEDDPLIVLYKFELIKNDKPTNACHLLFANTDVFNATIELGRFSTPILIKDGATIRQDLFTEIDEVINFIKKHINKGFVISGNAQRQERWEYPMDAIREIVINMIVHRDYMDSGDSSIKIHNDKIEFFNPGKLPDSISIKNLISGKYVSEVRNKKIASVFKEAGFIEKYGSGIKRILNSFTNYGLITPVFENFQNGFLVTISSTKINEGVNEGVNEGINEGVNNLFQIIKTSPLKRTPYFAQKLNTSIKNIERWIKQLKDAEQIEFKGSPKNGGYIQKKY